MTLRVHVLHAADPAERGALEGALEPSVSVTFGLDVPEPGSVQILVSGRPPEGLLDSMTALERIVVPWAGIPPALPGLLAGRPGIAVHNLHHNAPPTAETAVALLLAAAKRLVPMDRALRRHDWTPRYADNPSTLLDGKGALVLGFGAIGRRVARACRGLGMRVAATRRRSGPPAEEDGIPVHAAEELHALLPAAHALLVTVPLTDETRRLIGARELALLPQGAVVVNVARGPVIDEDALFEALTSGHLHSAGLDVWWNYPADEAARAHTPASSRPFHELDNVVMSPHRAGGSGEGEVRRMAALAELLNAVAAGHPPHPVDLATGY